MASIGKDFGAQRKALVDRLVQEGIVKSDRVRRAFIKVPREEFVFPDTLHNAYFDSPLPLGGSGQTISAPHMVAIMLEELSLHPGLSVLEVGAGSGYSAALMAELMRSENAANVGHITTLERVPLLVEFARKNLKLTGYSDLVSVVECDGTLGYPERGEDEIYDRITITAAAPYIPRYLKMQLKVGGIMVIPVGSLWSQDLLRIVKLEGGKLTENRRCSCIFVPLVGADGYSY